MNRCSPETAACRNSRLVTGLRPRCHPDRYASMGYSLRPPFRLKRFWFRLLASGVWHPGSGGREAAKYPPPFIPNMGDAAIPNPPYK